MHKENFQRFMTRIARHPQKFEHFIERKRNRKAIHGTGKGGAFIQQGAVSDVTSALFFEFQLSEKTEESVSTRARTVVTREIVSL